MTTDPQITAWLDQEDAHLARVIRTHRFAVQYVGSGDGPVEPPFGYTIGLFGVGHPELVVVGLGHDAAHGALDHVGRSVVAGRNLVPGQLVGDDSWPLSLTVEVLPNPGEVLFSANRFYERPAEFSVPAFQLTWPDAGGAFPWEPGYVHPPDVQPRPGRWRA
ncbi:MAG: DUF4262 domain-containing protein [Actinomycetes bacterium]